MEALNAMMGPKPRRNTGTDFQEQIDRLFREQEPLDTEKQEAEEERDKKREANEG